jgi:hypothetical protein
MLVPEARKPGFSHENTRFFDQKQENEKKIWKRGFSVENS